MELKSFSVEKYRSINSAKKIALGRSTILIGPNNEGKSNLLRALVTAMNILTRERHSTMRNGRHLRGLIYRRDVYDWERDFPVRLQHKNPNGQSVMLLEFELTEDELQDFRQEIKSQLTGTLPIRVAISAKVAEVSVAKQGRGSKTLSQKSDRIAKFVTDRIDFQNIQAVRTADAANEVVSDMIARELKQLEENQAYQDALATLDELQKPILDEISDSIKSTLRQFLKDVRDVEVSVPSAARYRALRRSCEIIVDDGTPTLLEHKGDGVQSLAALGLTRYAAERGAKGKNLVVAIEEPESHLHSDAIHELREVIIELGLHHQIIISTHNPLFVDRLDPSNNIIVNNSKATPARSVPQIRDALGVRASDNLRHAELVLVVEGEDDRRSIASILKDRSESLREALSNGTLSIDSLSGGSNLTYKLSSIRSAICEYHAFLDDDRAGRDGFDKAKAQGLIADAQANFCSRDGLTEAELEDAYDTSLYQNVLWEEFGVSILSPRFKSKKKWSDRMKDCFKHCGKQWNEKTEARVKSRLSFLVEETPESAVNIHHAGPIEMLIKSLEERLSRSAKAKT